MAVTVDPSTAAGSYPLTITGTSGTIVHTASVTLVVTVPVPPDFSVTASPGSRSVQQGGSTTYTASVTPSNGYTGTVTFSVSGLPAGAGGSFNPPSVTTSGNSTLTVTTDGTTPAGTYTVTVTGSDGTLTRSSNVTLVVTAPAPDFTISATPASRTISRGSSTSYTVTIGSVNSFNGAVNLSVSGLPARASASFSPASVNGSGTATLTINTQNGGPKGSISLTITGTSGSLSHSTGVTLVLQ
jgi:uncharacterized membrane protein